MTVSDLVPEKKGQSRLIRAELDPPPDLPPLEVRVTIGDREKILEKVIRAE